MSLLIDTPTTAWARQTIVLDNLNYTFIFSLNGRDNRVRFDIYLDDEPVILGVKVMENQSLLARYNLDEFSHGDLYCIRVQNDNNNVTLDNLGINKAYELVYLDNEELQELGA